MQEDKYEIEIGVINEYDECESYENEVEYDNLSVAEKTFLFTRLEENEYICLWHIHLVDESEEWRNLIRMKKGNEY